ncbi:MAG: P-II family nitrogen regulator [Bacteroidota bacterium]
MKEIKAYVRPEVVDEVISHLEAVGIKGMTVIDVSMLGNWADPENSKISMEYCERYCKVVKIELVCQDEVADLAVQTILDHAHSGRKGDGKIFVADIIDAISIRTKQHGKSAL